MTTVERLTPDQLDTLIRDHLSNHPDADPHDVARAVRNSGWAQDFQIMEALDKIRPTPTLTTVAEATVLLDRLAGQHEWVYVFWDRGWGDSGNRTDITICVNGNGDMPYAYLTRDAYRALVDQRIVESDSYGGHKARRVHDYKPSVR